VCVRVTRMKARGRAYMHSFRSLSLSLSLFLSPDSNYEVRRRKGGSATRANDHKGPAGLLEEEIKRSRSSYPVFKSWSRE